MHCVLQRGGAILSGLFIIFECTNLSCVHNNQISSAKSKEQSSSDVQAEGAKLCISTCTHILTPHVHTHSCMHECIHTVYTIHTSHVHTHKCTHTYKHTAPLGYILSKDELHILQGLLASYSNEKIQSIQLSLQEKQEIRDISREEVEKSLRQSGLEAMADSLKDNLEKGTIFHEMMTISSFILHTSLQ